MSTYARPTGTFIRMMARLSGDMFEVADQVLDGALVTKIQQGEDDVFSRVGVGYETDTGLTDRQVRHLQRAVAHRTAAIFLWQLLVDRTTGTFVELLVADPAAVQELWKGNEELAEMQESLLLGGGQAVDSKPFSLPVAASSTFTVSPTDRTPSARTEALDEMDNISLAEAVS